MAAIKTEVILEAQAKGFEAVVKTLEQVSASIEKIANKKFANTGFKDLTRSISQQTIELQKSLGNLQIKMDQMNGSVKNLGDTMTKLGESFKKSGDEAGRFGDKLSVQWTMKSFIGDIEKMIAVQLRWYSAQLLTVEAVRAIGTAYKESFQYSITKDTAQASLSRYPAMEGKSSEDSKAIAGELVNTASDLQVKLGVSFDDIVKSADRLLSAGVGITEVKKSLESFGKLQVAFPEIEAEKFTTAIVGLLNTFRESNSLAQFEGDSAKMTALMDKSAKALSMFVLAPRDMGPLLQNMAQLSQISGFTVDQMFALAGMITNLGAKAGNAGRLISGLFASLATTKTQDELIRIGVQIDKNKSIAEQFDNIINGIRNAVGTGAIAGLNIAGMEEIGKITSVERQRVLSALVRDFDQLAGYANDIGNSSGTINKAWTQMDDTFERSWEKLKGISLQMGNIAVDLLTPFKDIKEMLKEIVAFSGKLLSDFKAIAVIREETRRLGAGEYKTKEEKWAAGERIMKAGRSVLYNFLGEPPPDDVVSAMDSDMWPPEVKAKKNDRKNPPPAKGKDYSARFSDLAFREMKQETQMEEYLRQERLSRLEVEYQTGLITTKEYNARKNAITREAVEEEFRIIEEGATKVIEAWTKERASVAPGKDAAEKIKLIDEKLMTSLGEIGKRRAEVVARQTKSDTEEQIKTWQEGAKRTREELEIIYEETLARDKSFTDQQLTNADIRTKQLKDQYDKGYVNAKTYFDEMYSLADTNTALQISLRRLELQAWIDFNSALSKTDEETKKYEEEKAKRIIKTGEAVTDLQTKLRGTKAGLDLEKGNTPEMVFKSFSGKDQGMDTFSYYLAQATKDFQNWGLQIKSIADETAKGMSQGMSDFFFDVITNDFKSFEDYFRTFTHGILRSITNLWAQQMTKDFASLLGRAFGRSYGASQGGANYQGEGTALIGGLVEHSGGVIGQGGPMRFVPSGVFANAPRYHSGGVAGDEVPAILQKGETVLPRGYKANSSQDVKVEIINGTGTEAKISNSQVRFDGQQMIVTAWLDALQTNKYGLRSALGG